MTTAIIIAGALIALAAFVAKYMKVAKKDNESDDDHSDYAELRCVTKITTQSNQEGFWI